MGPRGLGRRPQHNVPPLLLWGLGPSARGVWGRPHRNRPLPPPWGRGGGGPCAALGCRGTRPRGGSGGPLRFGRPLPQPSRTAPAYINMYIYTYINQMGNNELSNAGNSPASLTLGRTCVLCSSVVLIRQFCFGCGGVTKRKPTGLTLQRQ